MKTIAYLFRKLQRGKLPNYLGIAGLATGLVCVLYIFLWVHNEISYDRFHKNSNEIFVVHAILEGGEEPFVFRGAPPAVAPALQNEYPQVQATARMMPAYSEWMLSYGGEQHMRYTAFADFSLFDIFSFEFSQGSKGELLAKNQVVLTESTAVLLFGASKPVGQIIRLNNAEELTVSGVIKDLPGNSSIQFQALVSLDVLTRVFANEHYLDTWYNNAFSTYGLLNDAQSFPQVAEGVKNRIQQSNPDSTNFLSAYKFKDTWLYQMNNIRSIRMFSLIGLLILLTAILNFVNLNTARSARQVKENGIRRSLGALRGNLVKIVYSEVALVCLLSFGLALLVGIIGLPSFNGLISKELTFVTLLQWQPLLVLLLILVLTIGLSGLYPALVLSGYSPLQSLRSSITTVKSKGVFRNILIISIFVLSIGLLSATLVINKQMLHLQRMDLGFSKEQLVYLRLNGQLQSQAGVLQDQLKRHPHILSSSILSGLPNALGNNGQGWDWEQRNPDFKPLVFNWYASPDLLETLEMDLAEGSFFRENQQNAVVINRTFARMIGWDHFAGRNLSNWGNGYEITGVVEDLKFNNVGEATNPLVIFPATNSWEFGFLAVKISPNNIGETLAFIREAANTIEPAFPLQLSFLDDDYKIMLAPENNLRKLIAVFTLFAVVVLTLGLIGLIMFLAEQKTKEIGIRKSLGEAVASIIWRLLTPFLKAGLFSALLAIPLSWLAMRRWLENYAQRIELDVLTFLLAAFSVVLLALLTVSLQSWNAARKNPVAALRNE